MSIVHKFMAYPVLYTAVYKCASEINKSASGAKGTRTSPISIEDPLDPFCYTPNMTFRRFGTLAITQKFQCQV